MTHDAPELHSIWTLTISSVTPRDVSRCATPGTILPPLEIMRRVDALLDHYESRALATKLGVSETSTLKVALRRPVYADTLRQVIARLDAVEREVDAEWLADIERRTGARPLEEPTS